MKILQLPKVLVELGQRPSKYHQLGMIAGDTKEKYLPAIKQWLENSHLLDDGPMTTCSFRGFPIALFD